jgi:hypothetical protein
MLKMLNAFLTVQALHVAAALDLADRLADGPRSADEVASETGADPTSLYRLMRMLTGLGVLSEEADGQFALAPLGATLRSDVANSVRDWALFVGAPEMWEVWAGLHGSVMTREAAFPRVHGAAMWDYMAEHPHLGQGKSERAAGCLHTPKSRCAWSFRSRWAAGVSCIALASAIVAAGCGSSVANSGAGSQDSAPSPSTSTSARSARLRLTKRDRVSQLRL